MSYQEIAKSMIDHLPEDKMIFVINMLEGLGEMSGLDIHPDFKPNATTIAAMAETDEMIKRLEAGSILMGQQKNFSPEFWRNSLKNKDHSLKGNYTGLRECRISTDWLLIYRIDGNERGCKFFCVYR